jgi:hypothetical protein
MPSDLIQMNMQTWTASSSTTATGKSHTDDLVSDLAKTLNDFFTEMAPIYFLNSTQSLQTALEEFGQGMNAALACVSIDLQVVSSGLASAVSAFGATDKALANTFAHLDAQLGYYTNTAASTTIPKPTAANLAALNAEYQQYYGANASGSAGTGISVSQQQIQNSARVGLGLDSFLTALLIVGVCLA